MWANLQDLKDPNLVAKIQQYFGVHVPKCGRDAAGNEYKQKPPKVEITNKFWFYLFCFGTALGDEIFYASFIPFWFWNVDGAVGRRVVLVWAIVMYIGQGIKDILRWPRPGPPVIQLQDKWCLEYGMPSTHAMVAVSIPFSVLLYTMDRYQYPTMIGTFVAIAWCSIVCLSRLYLGMHTILDIIAGLLLSLLLMIPLIPLVDRLDNILLTSPHSPLILLTVSILMIVYYPSGDKWTPTRGDTTMIVSVCVGVHIGAWMNYQMGSMYHPDLTPPYTVLWPTFLKAGQTILRTVLGMISILVTKIASKWLTYAVLCTMLRIDAAHLKKSENTLQNKHKTFVDLSYKYISCAAIGFNTLYVLPQLFRYLAIERPTFYTEI